MRGKVLVVEDDYLVRLTVCHYLQGMGWQVEEVDSGDAALKALAAAAENIAAVLTDLRLPDMSGVELAVRVRSDCPVIFMSGTLVDPEFLPGPVLRKPFDEETLRGVLSSVMALPAPGH